MHDHLTEPSARPLRVLVVDDSALARQTLVALLTRDRGLTVTVAQDAMIARERIRARRPDVVVLDLEMPRMDGLTFLREVMRHDPLPVVVCAAIDERSADAAMRAIELGAIDVIAKPRVPAQGLAETDAALLVCAVRGAAEACVGGHRARQAAPRVRGERRAVRGRSVVAFGASVGGPQALLQLLRAAPVDAPPMLVVQHMPAGFTGAFARQLAEVCPLEVKEAERGDLVRPGRVLVAPGGMHLIVTRQGGQQLVDLVAEPAASLHRPSVDVLFGSLADVVGADAIGVLLTGMGTDGADGLARMKARGAMTIAQDRASCAVFGMPRAAIDRGVVDHVAPLSDIGSLVFEPSSAGTPARKREG